MFITDINADTVTRMHNTWE